MNDFVQRCLAEAEDQVEGGDTKKALSKLEDALWNVRAVDDANYFERIQLLAVRVADVSDGRVRAKARLLVALCDERRREVMKSGASPTTGRDVRPWRVPAHTRRRSLAWRLKLGGVSLIGLLGVFFAWAGATDSTANAGSTVAVVVIVLIIVAIGRAAWRHPGTVGLVAIGFAPLGFFLVLLGSTNLDPTSQVVLATLVLAGLPLLAGVLLVLAARVGR